MTPEQLRSGDSTEFVSRALADRTRVLEVGCGRGHLACQLAARGLEVTALDLQLRDLVAAPSVRFVESNFLDYDDLPFDAIVFVASLHHISPLAHAIDRAARLLRTDGLLVVDDFDLDAPDVDTLRWYYDTQELLTAAGCYPADHVDESHHDVVERWQHAHRHAHAVHTGDAMHAHHHAHALHTGAAMHEAIAARFTIRDTHRLEYLYRYIAGGLAADERGAKIAAQVRATERRRIAEGAFQPVGLRIVAQRCW